MGKQAGLHDYQQIDPTMIRNHSVTSQRHTRAEGPEHASGLNCMRPLDKPVGREGLARLAPFQRLGCPAEDARRRGAFTLRSVQAFHLPPFLPAVGLNRSTMGSP